MKPSQGTEMLQRASEAPRAARKRGSRPSCGAETRAGGPCSAHATMPDGRCPHHTTTVSDKTKQTWRQRGNAASRRARMPVTFTPADFASEDGARKMLEEAANLVRAGKMPVSVANAVSKLAATALKAAELRHAEALAEVERRLRERGGSPRRQP